MLHPARPRGTHHHPRSHQHNSLGCCMQKQICQTTQLCSQGWYWGPSVNFSPAICFVHPLPSEDLSLFSRCCSDNRTGAWSSANYTHLDVLLLLQSHKSDFMLHAQVYKRYPLQLHCCNSSARCFLFLPKCRKWSPEQG